MADEAPADTTTPEATTQAIQPEAVTDAPAPAADAEADDGSVLGGEAPAPEAAADPEAPAAPVIPEKYELTPPEGMALDEETIALADPVFRELGLDNDAAQKLMPVAGEFAKRVGATAIAQHEIARAGEFTTLRRQWVEDAKADSEIGGASWDDTVTHSAKALDSLGFPAGSPLRSYLTETGLGNHPEMIRLMRRIGERVGEDTFHRGETAQAETNVARILYPNDKPKGA